MPRHLDWSACTPRPARSSGRDTSRAGLAPGFSPPHAARIGRDSAPARGSVRSVPRDSPGASRRAPWPCEGRNPAR